MFRKPETKQSTEAGVAAVVNYVVLPMQFFCYQNISVRTDCGYGLDRI